MVSGHYADPSIRHGVAGLQTSFPNLSLLRLFWQQNWCAIKGLLHTSVLAALNAMGIIFFPHGSGPQCLWCIPKSPGDHFPLPPTSFKKKESSFLCCRNDKGSSSRSHPRARIVKTDLVLSPRHRCGWLFSREVRQGELNKLIWLPLVQTFLVRTYWGKISIKRAKAGKGHLAYLVHFLKSKQTFEKIRITPYPFTLFPCTEDGRV